MRQRARRHVVDEAVEQAREAAGPGLHRAKPAATRSAAEEHVLGLQGTAGNQAVVQSLAANAGAGPLRQASVVAGSVAAAQRQAAQAAPAPAYGPDFEATWRDEVIIPLGRVTFLVEEEGIQLGAMRRLSQALKAILDVLNATRRDDPNWYRVQLLGRMVNALIDLVAMSGTSRPSNKELLDDMIIWRARAVELEPLVQHAPAKPGESPAEAWHELVVLPLGRAQVHLEESPAEALQGYLHAVEGITLTLQATPRTDPARLRIASLSVAVQGMYDRLQVVTGQGSPDVVGRAIEAFQAAEALGARLAGKPLTAPSGPAGTSGDADESKETVEKQFTWERKGGPILDSDQLERP